MFESIGINMRQAIKSMDPINPPAEKLLIGPLTTIPFELWLPARFVEEKSIYLHLVAVAHYRWLHLSRLFERERNLPNLGIEIQS